MSDPIRNTITDLFSSKPILKDIAADQDFFDVGASSLTIVDLQIQIEEALQVAVPTAQLMANPTLDAWVAAYADAQAAAYSHASVNGSRVEHSPA